MVGKTPHKSMTQGGLSGPEGHFLLRRLAGRLAGDCWISETVG